MAGFAHDLAGGGGNLVISSFQSPNYVPGVSGWQVTIEGDAEFNDIVIRGEFQGNDWFIDSTGAFFYSGTPALNTLVMSIAATGGTDPYGNTYGPGFYFTDSSGAYASMASGSGRPSFVFQAAGLIHSTLQSLIFAAPLNPGADNESQLAVMTSGKSGGDDAALQLYSEAADGSSPAQAIIEFGGVTAIDFARDLITSNVPITAQDWQPMTLLNGWTANASFAAPQYRYVASPPNTVEIIGAVAGNAASGNVFAQLPSGYLPGSAQGFPVGSTAAADNTNGRCDTSGNLQIANVTFPAAQTFFFHAFISTDA